MTDMKNLQVDDDLQLPLESKDTKTAAPAEETVEELRRQIAERDKKAEAALATAEAERRGRLEAEARVGTATQEVEQYKTQAQTAEQQAITNAIEAATRESESAQRELEAALNAGEYNSVGKIQAKIAKAAALLVQHEAMKVAIDARVANPQQVRVDISPRYADATEAFLSGFSPRTQGWLRSHRNLVVTDARGVPSLSNKAMTAHYSALDQNLAAESDEYYDFIENQIAPQRDDADAEPVPQRRAPIAAPVSRDTPAHTGRQSTKIRLTPEQVETARISGITPEAYAENLRQLTAEGKMGRTTH